MNEVVKVVIPSYHRADMVRALAIPNSIVCVPQCEYDDYVKYCGLDRVVPHPDSVVGIAPKRQWIIERFRNVFMIDDEFDHLVRIYLKDDDPMSKHCTPEETYDIIQSTASLCKELNGYLFGFNKSANPLYFNPVEPFAASVSMTNMIYLGLGVLDGGKLFIAKDLGYCEDTFLNLINAYYNRFCLIDKRFSYPFAQNDKNGMTTSGKDPEMWNKNTKRLTEYFSQAKIVGKTDDGCYDVKIEGAFK